MLKSNKLKGRILEVMGDPFYKDYVLFVDPREVEKFQDIRTVAGNHRYLYKNQVKVPENDLVLMYYKSFKD